MPCADDMCVYKMFMASRRVDAQNHLGIQYPVDSVARTQLSPPPFAIHVNRYCGEWRKETNIMCCVRWPHFKSNTLNATVSFVLRFKSIYTVIAVTKESVRTVYFNSIRWTSVRCFRSTFFLLLHFQCKSCILVSHTHANTHKKDWSKDCCNLN